MASPGNPNPNPNQPNPQPFNVQKFFNSPPPPPSPTTSQNPSNPLVFPTPPPLSSYPPPSSAFSDPPQMTPFHHPHHLHPQFHHLPQTPPFHHPHLPQAWPFHHPPAHHLQDPLPSNLHQQQMGAGGEEHEGCEQWIETTETSGCTVNQVWYSFQSPLSFSFLYTTTSDLTHSLSPLQIDLPSSILDPFPWRRHAIQIQILINRIHSPSTFRNSSTPLLLCHLRPPPKTLATRRRSQLRRRRLPIHLLPPPSSTLPKRCRSTTSHKHRLFITLTSPSAAVSPPSSLPPPRPSPL
ncbi:hypothetical protein TIFTF001_033066 [Ficus carica]|uniref:Uncharacterized protein n=1 Tax=Ficus carica TaxID=3494 RepID=A0AA88E1A9_FICCA|nr:hypothetical protein TIFTF001_033066 [Ficus carica]